MFSGCFFFQPISGKLSPPVIYSHTISSASCRQHCSQGLSIGNGKRPGNEIAAFSFDWLTSLVFGCWFTFDWNIFPVRLQRLFLLVDMPEGIFYHRKFRDRIDMWYMICKNSPIKHCGPFVEIMGDIRLLLHGENRKLLGSFPSLARENMTKLPARPPGEHSLVSGSC